MSIYIFIKDFFTAFGSYFYKIIGFLGFVVGFLFIIKQTIEVIPILKKKWVNYLKWRAGKNEYKEYKKTAIKADIENVINSITSEIRKEIPKDWIKKANIEWLEKSEDFQLENNEIIMRIKPLENEDDNVLNATYSFFKSIIFPKVRSIISDSILEASALKITHRVIDSEKPFLLNKFEEETIENVIKKNEVVARYFGKLSALDARGFFTSFFIREIDKLAHNVRMDERRLKINNEIDEILDHAISFSNSIFANEKCKDDLWIRKGLNSYAFLLVAREENQNVNTYVEKAKMDKDMGINRLYVIGRSERAHFTRNVIRGISKAKGFRLLDKCKLFHDYKGNVGGIGAMFDVNN